MTSDIYFIYNYFLRKMGQAQNERKKYICEKAGINSDFLFFSSYFAFYYIKKRWTTNIYKKKKILSLTSNQGFTDKLERIK